MRLSTEAYRYGADSGDALVTLSHLALHQAGLIALTGGPDGVIDRAIAANDFRFAESALKSLKRSSATGSTSSCSGTACRRRRTAEPQLLDLAYDHHLPIVATNEPISRAPTITRRTTRCSASPKAATSPRTSGGA